MIVLDSVQILAAVSRSLEAHVLPELRDGFARVQLQSTLKALAQVRDRLERGDPCERSNAIIESGVRELAEAVRDGSPEFAAGLDASLAGTPEGDAPRDRARQLGDALWRLVSESDDPAAARLLALLSAEAIRTMNEDNAWMCPEAIASLT